MRIVHLIASADPSGGGPIEGAMRMGVRLMDKGHDYALATLDSADAPYVAGTSVPVVPLGPGSWRAGEGASSVGARLIGAARTVDWLRTHAGDIDVAIVSGLWNASTLAARFGLAANGIPYVVFTHGMLDPWFTQRYPLKTLAKRFIWPWNEAVLLRQAERVLFTCDEERMLAQSSFSPYAARETVIGFGAASPEDDAERSIRSFQARLPDLGEAPFLLFLSRIHPKKGVDLLIEAFGRLAPQQPQLHLVVAGPDPDGMRPQLERIAQDFGVQDRVHWPGMLVGDPKWGALRACEAFVLPSHQENFGIVLAEAMACGRPVVTTDKVNIWREIAADGAGRICRDEPQDLFETLRAQLRLVPDDVAAMGARAEASFARRYRMEGFVERLDSLLAECRRPRLRPRRRALAAPGQSGLDPAPRSPA